MICLGIETSCDDTGIALVEDGILKDSLLASQEEVHAIFGGVVPELASREHYRFLPALYDRLMARNHADLAAVDLIAVARGPGLLGSLLVGVAFAKGLVLASRARLIGVDHLRAHLLACALEQQIMWPALGLLVSGGHTRIYLATSPYDFQLLGRSLDDAAGEAFDKTGKLLGLAYPAGRAMDVLAQAGECRHELPRATLSEDSLNFSFSGLKAACARLIAEKSLGDCAQRHERLDEVRDFCASLNEAVAQTLRIKLERALKQHPEVHSILLAGGVAANSLVRKKIAALADSHCLQFATPTPALCQDNGAMIAFAGYLASLENLRHGLDLEAIPRGRAVPQDYVCQWESSKG